MKFSKKYPFMKTISIGDNNLEHHSEFLKEIKVKSLLEIVVEFMEVMTASFKQGK